MEESEEKEKKLKSAFSKIGIDVGKLKSKLEDNKKKTSDMEKNVAQCASVKDVEKITKSIEKLTSQIEGVKESITSLENESGQYVKKKEVNRVFALFEKEINNFLKR